MFIVSAAPFINGAKNYVDSWCCTVYKWAPQLSADSWCSTVYKRWKLIVGAQHIYGLCKNVGHQHAKVRGISDFPGSASGMISKERYNYWCFIVVQKLEVKIGRCKN